MLCTGTRTYAFRSVQLSNSHLILTGDDDGALLLRDQVNEVIELMPVVPKLDRLTSLLRENVYTLDGDDEEDEAMDDDRPVSRIGSWSSCRADIHDLPRSENDEDSRMISFVAWFKRAMRNLNGVSERNTS